MKRGMMEACATLVFLAALIPASTRAYPVGSPMKGHVSAAGSTSDYHHGSEYYGSEHKSLDISGGSCGSTPITTAIVGSLSWTVVINTPATYCSGDSANVKNEAYHNFANGYVFRLKYFNKTDGSFNRTCDRCNIGTLSGTIGGIINQYVHMEYAQYGTRVTSWYAGYTTQGEQLDLGEVVGYVN